MSLIHHTQFRVVIMIYYNSYISVRKTRINVAWSGENLNNMKKWVRTINIPAVY